MMLVRMETACDGPDGDGDGIPDACDPCTATAALVRPKLVLRRINTPEYDDTVSLRADISLPPATPVDPRTTGLRVLLEDTSGSTVADAVFPAGTGGIHISGWIANTKASSFDYKHITPSLAYFGFQKVTLKRNAYKTRCFAHLRSNLSQMWLKPRVLPCMASVIFALTPVPGDPKNGCVGPFASGALKKELKKGLMYLNVHTTQFPNGEIRGQIIPTGR